MHKHEQNISSTVSHTYFSAFITLLIWRDVALIFSLILHIQQFVNEYNVQQGRNEEEETEREREQRWGW